MTLFNGKKQMPDEYICNGVLVCFLSKGGRGREKREAEGEEKRGGEVRGGATLRVILALCVPEGLQMGVGLHPDGCSQSLPPVLLPNFGTVIHEKLRASAEKRTILFVIIF